MARSRNKKKATAREHATERIASRERTGSTAKVPASTKEMSVSRFPGETPPTGEDRPANRPGGKQNVREIRKGTPMARRGVTRPGGA